MRTSTNNPEKTSGTPDGIRNFLDPSLWNRLALSFDRGIAAALLWGPFQGSHAQRLRDLAVYLTALASQTVGCRDRPAPCHEREFADALGLPIGTVLRALRSLERRGFVRPRGRRILRRWFVRTKFDVAP